MLIAAARPVKRFFGSPGPMQRTGSGRAWAADVAAVTGKERGTPMGAFVILLHEEEPESTELRKRIEDRFPGSDHYKFAEHLHLVTGPGW